MKVDLKGAVQAGPTVKAQPFKKLLAEARSELTRHPVVAKPTAQPTARPVTSAVAPSRTAMTSANVVHQRARVHAEGEAQRLGAVRTEHARTADALVSTRSHQGEAIVERSEARVLDFILRELTEEPVPPARPLTLATVHHLQPASHAEAKVEAPPEAKAAQAVALIEKIELFVRSQRPGLALTLNNSLGAHVEIERIGPMEIALKLVGHRGPPSAEAVSRIREELRARGLKVGALSVA